MRFHWGYLAAFCTVAVVGQVASASVIYEDNYYWLGDGTVVMNPTDPPAHALLRIEETVYADDQGRALLGALTQIGAVHGDAIPTEAFDLYTYHITNMDLVLPSGVTGFVVANVGVPVLGQWAPSRAFDGWTGINDPSMWMWGVDTDQDTDMGDGWGILSGTAFGGFMFAVPQGTPHSTSVPAAIFDWSAEEPGGSPVLQVFGLVSGPVPEPATLALVGFGGALALLARRRRR